MLEVTLSSHPSTHWAELNVPGIKRTLRCSPRHINTTVWPTPVTCRITSSWCTTHTSKFKTWCTPMKSLWQSAPRWKGRRLTPAPHVPTTCWLRTPRQMPDCGYTVWWNSWVEGHSTLTRTASSTSTSVESGIQTLATSWGDLKDEYPHKELTQYVGLGAKNYAIRFTDCTSECKVRGFILNYQTSKMIDFDTMLEMLQKKLSLSCLLLFFVWACVLILSFLSQSTMHSPVAKSVKWAEQTTQHNVHASIVSATLRENNHC